MKAHHAEILAALLEGLSTILAGENEELKVKALEAAKVLVHKDTFALFKEHKLHADIEELTKSQGGPLQLSALTILAAND